MIRQELTFPVWDWRCAIFYDVVSDNADIILSALQEIGCSGATLARAERNLYSGITNTGLTFTNPECRCSVMVIGHTSTPAQFWNTLDHEKGHLAEHIAEALLLDRRAEAFEYLKGDIAQAMYPVAVRFLCRCRY